MKKLISVSLAFLLTFTCSLAAPSSWAENDCDEAVKLGLVPDHLQNSYQQPITREEFCEMAISLLNVCGLDLSSIDTSHCYYADTNSKYVLQATALGIVNGVGGTGTTSLFAPKKLITRQEAATMLYRLTQTAVIPDADASLLASHTWSDRNSSPEYLSDGVEKSHFYSWALDGIAFCYNSGVMVGLPNNKFGPNDYYTIEQSAITFLRLFRWAESDGKNNKASQTILIDTDATTQTYGYTTLSGEVLVPKILPIPQTSTTDFVWDTSIPHGKYIKLSSDMGVKIMSIDGQFVNTVTELEDVTFISDKCAWIFYTNDTSAVISLPSGKVLYENVLYVSPLSDELWSISFGDDESSKCGIINGAGEMIVDPVYKYFSNVYQDCFVAITDMSTSPALYDSNGKLLSRISGIESLEQSYYLNGFGPYLVLQNSFGQISIFHYDGTVVFDWGQLESPNIEFMQEGLISGRLNNTSRGERHLFDFSGNVVSKPFLDDSEGEVLYGRYIMDILEGNSYISCLCDKDGNILRKNLQGVISDGGNCIAWISFEPDPSDKNHYIKYAIVADENGQELFRASNAESISFQDGLVRISYPDKTIRYYSTSGVALN